MTMLTQEVRPTETGRWRWTRYDCLFMERAGLLKGRYELIDGEVVVKSGVEGRKRWTRQECEFLENAGLLKGRYELIDGEIVSKMSQNGAHALAVILMMEFLIRQFGARRVRSQTTLEITNQDRSVNRPEPDGLVLKAESAGTPTADNALLVVEVSDTTLGYDLSSKAVLYARAGIEEYWVLDINRRVLIALRHPQGNDWREWVEYDETEQLAPISAPNAFVRVGDLLPPVTGKESAE